MSRAYAVASGVAAAYHKHVFALGAYQLVFSIFASGEHTILLCKHVERKIHAFKLSARYGKVARRGRSRGYHVCVEAFGQLGHVDVLIIFKGYSLLHQHVYAAVYHGLVELKVRYAVAQQSAGILVLVEHRNHIALQVKAVGSHQSGRSGSYHGHLLAVALRMMYAHIVLLEGVFGYGSLILAVGCRLMLHKIEHAGLLAESRTDAPRELRKVVGRVEQPVSQLPVAFIQSVVPLRRLVAQRTSPVAERHSAVHAARCLHAAVVRVERLLHLAKVMYTVVHRPVSRFLAVYSQKCFWISHVCYIINSFEIIL